MTNAKLYDGPISTLNPDRPSYLFKMPVNIYHHEKLFLVLMIYIIFLLVFVRMCLYLCAYVRYNMARITF